MTPKNKAQLIGALNPKAWDAIIPHGPVNDYLVELFVADAVRTTSAEFGDKALKKRGMALSAKMATKATHGMLAGWEDGDDICPPLPWPKKYPIPFGPFSLLGGPDTLPAVNAKSLQLTELVSTLVALSSLTMEKEFNAEIKGLASAAAQGISSQFADEVEKCGTVPRKHWGGGPGPKPHAIATAPVANSIVG